MKYCDVCGSKLDIIEKDVAWYCPRHKWNLYANPIPTIDAMLFDENGRILLGVRSDMPDKGKLNLPGGFVDMNETYEEALARELKEELGLSPADYGQLVYAGSRVNKHTQQGRQRQLVSMIMVGEIAHRDFPANDEVDRYVWKKPSEIKPDEVTNSGEYEHIQKAAEIKPKL